MADFGDLQKEIIKYRDARNWQQFHNPKDLAISLSLEASEVLEHFQWKTPEEIEEHLKNELDEVSDELIDVLYWVLLMAHDLGVDIDKSFKRKMAKNARKYPVSKSKGSHAKYTELK